MSETVRTYLTPREAAEQLQVNYATVMRWVRSGRLSHTLLPTGRVRFTQEDIDGAQRRVVADRSHVA